MNLAQAEPGGATADARHLRLHRYEKARLVLSRAAITVALLFVVSVIIFAATQALPGDIAVLILGRDATPESVAALRAQLHLDQPVAVQYLSWLHGILQGDFGRSIGASMPVSELIGPRIANSLIIVAVSMALSIPFSFVAAVFSARFKDGIADQGLMALTITLNALPEFGVALLLVIVFSTNVFHVLPAVSLITPTAPTIYQVEALVLPILTLFLVQVTYLYRLVRGSMIDVLSSDYIQFAELRGLGTSRILFRHALPNAAVPAIQAAATVFGFSIGGVVVVEYVFGFPGIGTAFRDAVGNRDIPVVQFIALFIASAYFAANIVADILAASLTPPGMRR